MPEKIANPFVLFFLLLPFQFNHADSLPLSPDSIKVEDGDTLIVNFENGVHRVQLAGIDAPEDSDNPKLQYDIKRTGLNKTLLLALGSLSTDYLRNLLKNSEYLTLIYQPGKRDKYGRLSGDLIDHKGRSITALMVDNGYAVVSNQPPKAERIKLLQPLQDEALRKNKGIWGKDKINSRSWAGIKPTR